MSAYEAGKYVAENGSKAGKPASFVNRAIGKAFLAGEIVGGAAAGAYYGYQGVDVKEKLKKTKQ